MIKTQNGAGTPTSVTVTALESARATMANARDLSVRVQLLASRLLGLPVNGEAACKKDSACGVLPALYDVSNETAEDIARAHQYLDELERQF